MTTTQTRKWAPSDVSIGRTRSAEPCCFRVLLLGSETRILGVTILKLERSRLERVETKENREEAKKKITHSDGSGKRVPTRTHTICIVVVRMYVCKGGGVVHT